MSGLTRDEYVEIAAILRDDARMVPDHAPGREAAKHLRMLADKLEVEPTGQYVLVSPLLKRAIALLKAARGEGVTHELHDQIATFLDGGDHEYPLELPQHEVGR